ncbi:hypothetical protein C2G38_2027624 [Gigaspora rosea]|uniref:Uncharacterized protein n=1 Tax=Gigaspora rosea TaxID=44941 RepID=A0A397W4A8_9GLOM|nr:hypothetical protein C2G38_2027624 [Gigaspora rosea]
MQTRELYIEIRKDMEHLQINKDIFTKKFQEIKQDLLNQEGNVLKKDKCIATGLGLHNPGLVTIIRRAIEVYSNISYKQSVGKNLTQEELEFIKFREEIESRPDKNQEIAEFKKKNNNKPHKIQKILIDNECGAMDYGLEEIQNREETEEGGTAQDSSLNNLHKNPNKTLVHNINTQKIEVTTESEIEVQVISATEHKHNKRKINETAIEPQEETSNMQEIRKIQSAKRHL